MSGLAALHSGVVFADQFRILHSITAGDSAVLYEVSAHVREVRRVLKVFDPSSERSAFQLASGGLSHEALARAALPPGRTLKGTFVPAIDAGIDRAHGLAWLSMEFVVGLDLETYVRREGPLPARAVGIVLGAVGEALAIRHAQGEAHGGLAPGHIMLGAARVSPFVRLLDGLPFGVIPEVGMHARPAAWAPPELAPHEPAAPRSDVWSLGLIGFIALTGRSFWQADPRSDRFDEELDHEKRTAPIPRATERARALGARELPDGFDDWFARCVTRNSAERFADAAEVLEGLPDAFQIREHRAKGFFCPPSPRGPDEEEHVNRRTADAALRRWGTELQPGAPDVVLPAYELTAALAEERIREELRWRKPATVPDKMWSGRPLLMLGKRDERAEDERTRAKEANQRRLDELTSELAHLLADLEQRRNRDKLERDVEAEEARLRAEDELRRLERSRVREESERADALSAVEIEKQRIAIENEARIQALRLAQAHERRLEPASEAKPRPHVRDDAQFTVYRPSALPRNEWKTLAVFAHSSTRGPDEPADAPPAAVRVAAERLLGDELARARVALQDATAAVPHEAELQLIPDVEGAEFNPPLRVFRWIEDVHHETFRVRADAGVPEGAVLRGFLHVRFGRLAIADIALTFTVGRTSDTKALPTTARGYRKVFVSYSTKDADVVEEVRGYNAVFGDRFLQDCRDFRSGEDWESRAKELIASADVFQLFWSTNAMRSSNVEIEWRYAFSLSRPNFVRPLYWEKPLPTDPARGLPPRELGRMHFQPLRRAGTKSEGDNRSAPHRRIKPVVLIALLLALLALAFRFTCARPEPSQDGDAGIPLWPPAEAD